MVREPLKGTLGHTFQDLEVIVVQDGPDPPLQLETRNPKAWGFGCRSLQVEVRQRTSVCWSVVAADCGRFPVQP